MVRLETAPTGLGTTKLTHKVRFPNRIDHNVQLMLKSTINSYTFWNEPKL